MTKPVYPNPIPKHLQHLSEWKLRALFYLFRPRQEGKMITLERIKNIAEDIIADDEWVNDSHTKAEHSGVKAGLYALIHHLEEVSKYNE